jgi:signal transduction histidine kinase
MTLRSRVSLALLLIAMILVAPAIYGLFALRQLQEIAYTLRTRDAVAVLALGRMQTALSEVNRWQANYLPLAIAGGDLEREQVRESIESHSADFEAQLDWLARTGYGDAVRPTVELWDRLQETLRQERALVDARRLDEAENYRGQVVAPVFDEMDASLHAMGEEINRQGADEVRRAQALAERSASTTLFSLGLALAAAVLIAGWLARSLLRPIHELRRGMSLVAEGDFEPRLAIAPHRPDELGDLARSFDRMTQQLAELNRLQAEFVSVASHELKTPLSVIKGYVSLLQEGIYGDVPEAQRKVLRSVSDQGDRLGRLIQQLLDISRFEAGGMRIEPRPIRLGSFLLELATSFEALSVPNQIEFQLEAAPGLPERIEADPDRLNEVVGNLLSNAFKFTPRGGSIWLRALPDEGGVIFEVQDTGIGIPVSQLPRIFEKFFQVENAAQPKSIGSGLGLAISREIVEAHGGTITAESREGVGTTFRVFLPQNSTPA